MPVQPVSRSHPLRGGAPLRTAARIAEVLVPDERRRTGTAHAAVSAIASE